MKIPKTVRRRREREERAAREDLRKLDELVNGPPQLEFDAKAFKTALIGSIFKPSPIMEILLRGKR